MIDRPTPETDAAAWIETDWENAIVRAKFARKLERERDEAREALKYIEEYGTEEINAAVELRQKLASTLVERDEAITRRMETIMQCELYEQERDEAREAFSELWQHADALLPEIDEETLNRWNKCIKLY